MRSLDNVPPYKDPDQQEITIALTKWQARLVLSALSHRFDQFHRDGLDELKSDVQKAYKAIDQQVYGTRLGREGISPIDK